MDILNFIKDVTKEADAFAHHPVKELSLEDRLLYLNGLALVMNADGQISDSEKEYLTILIKSFDLDQSLLNDLVAFAQSPDKDTALAFFRAFRRNPLAQLFLFDAYMMAMRDEDLHEKERAVIDKIAEQLEMIKGTQRDIFDLFCHIKHKDWEESSLYFSSHLLNPEHFKHLLEYYEVDLESLLATTNKLRERRLKAKMGHIFDHLEWIPLRYESYNQEVSVEGKEITKDFIDLSLTYGQILPFLQSMLDRRQVKVVGIKVVYQHENQGKEIELEYLDLALVKIQFDSLSRTFFIDKCIEDDQVEGKCFNRLIQDYWKQFGVDESLIASGLGEVDPDSSEIFVTFMDGSESRAISIIFPSGENRQSLEDEIVLGDDNNFYRNCEDLNVEPERVSVFSLAPEKPTINNKKFFARPLDMNIGEILSSGKIRLTR